MLKGSIQRDVNLTSFCSITAEVLPVEWLWFCICMFKGLSSKWAVVRTVLESGRWGSALTTAMGQVAKSFLFSACLPYLNDFVLSKRGWGKERKEGENCELDPAATLAHLISVCRVWSIRSPWPVFYKKKHILQFCPDFWNFERNLHLHLRTFRLGHNCM